MSARIFLAVLVLGFLSGGISHGAADTRLVRVDADGVIRWIADDREVALYGANYCLPSSCDYRAAGYVGADRKKLVEQDLAHFARLGWDAMRLSFWGDWENADRAGNLLVNDHLDVLDYAVAEARKRGIWILFSPITTYSAWWPDADPKGSYPGFSAFYRRDELGTNPAAIAAQCNYLRQILAHVNPYTGTALKDEPAILFIEMINEPVHHPEDFRGSVAYINALADAVRSTGCTKLLFHNLTQDRRIAEAIGAARVQGFTFGWYPTGLNSGRMLVGNYLRTVDDYPPLHDPRLARLPRLVYEFDAPDTNTACMYPAMARTFRSVGAQFAAMFSYDMLATAPYNLGWQTHFLNLVHSPKKAVSSLIAAEIMRRQPRGQPPAPYPENCRFGPFRLSYEEDNSEMVTDDTLLYANGTVTLPPAPEKLRRIVGRGDSPVITYEGSGAYFLDKLGDGLWRLELYPDAVLVQDPFAQELNHRTVSSRLIAREWPMTVRLPDLGDGFTVTPLDAGNARAVAPACGGRFAVAPGVYLLSRGLAPAVDTLPERVGRVGLREFVCPAAPELPPQFLPAVPAGGALGQSLTLAVEVVHPHLPDTVTLHWRAAGPGDFLALPLPRERAYRYAATLASAALPKTGLEYYFTARFGADEVRFPAGPADVCSLPLVAPFAELALFTAPADIPALVFTRIGDGIRHGIFKSLPASGHEPAALRLFLPRRLDAALDDYTASLAVADRLVPRHAQLGAARALRICARAGGASLIARVTLVEADGTAWTAALPLRADWSEIVVPLEKLAVGRGVKLPLGFPERWNYWLQPAAGRGNAADRLRTAQIEHLQISLSPPPGPSASGAPSSAEDDWIDLAAISLVW